MNTLYQVNGELFKSLKKGRKLRRLVDVVHGDKKPESIDLKNEHQFPQIQFELKWQKMERFLKQYEPINQRYLFGTIMHYMIPISHKNLDAFYYPPESVLWILYSFENLMWCIAEEKGQAHSLKTTQTDLYYESRGNRERAWGSIIAPEEMERAGKIFTHYIQENAYKVSYDSAIATPALNMYLETMVFLTQAALNDYQAVVGINN